MNFVIHALKKSIMHVHSMHTNVLFASSVVNLWLYLGPYMVYCMVHVFTEFLQLQCL